jgi:hypothetical protein
MVATAMSPADLLELVLMTASRPRMPKVCQVTAELPVKHLPKLVMTPPAADGENEEEEHQALPC